ncbi:ATP-binding protein [Desulforamulus aquiferis]|uniref:ATP-binding protein n=1 Tax=Desulforamulus aquiferis TaxID=1397668 RepID=A0AAW7ZFU7_9FIRM|nr:ATP-binding protein [Desulforamulus aquiferis]MDO7787896.1 ATP-binding protein [Desulforamulus aquiferis]
MSVQFKRAERKRAKLRLALAGPAGAGKTYSALLIAFGLGGPVAMIDTERGSGELYAHLGPYDVCTLTAPFTPEKYIEAIKAAEQAGYQTIIIDSLTHAWAGSGGVLDIQGHAADKSGNSWSAWRQVTPRHNDLVDTMLQSKCHIIVTMRSKMEHIQTTENGKTVIKKVGMNPIQRDGMDYEFTLFLDLDITHLASASKDRTSLFDGQVFKPNQEIGQKLLTWLDTEARESVTSQRTTAEIIDFPPGQLPIPDNNNHPGETSAAQARTNNTKAIAQQNKPDRPKPTAKTGEKKSQAKANQAEEDPFWNSINDIEPPPAKAAVQGNGRRRLF